MRLKVIQWLSLQVKVIVQVKGAVIKVKIKVKVKVKLDGPTVEVGKKVSMLA